MTRTRAIVAAALLLVASPELAAAQQSIGQLLGRPATPEGQPKTVLEEIALYGYVENSVVGNLGHESRGGVNSLRFYDVDTGYTFNAGELSVKKDPSEAHPWGFGVVWTAGKDSQKNHSLGIFRSVDDTPPYFRDTPEVELAEAYGSVLLPLGNGLTLKAGTWATLIGYEVYETPKNLNFSRSFLYTLGTPYFHTGLLASYPVAKWLTVSAGFTNGWDNADNNNGHLRPTGSFAFTPSDTLSYTVAWMVGPEQNRSQMANGDVNNRWIVDHTLLYTGIPQTTLALNFDFAGEENDPALVGLGRAGRTDSHWGGVAGYVAYDWTKALRTALRLGWFDDADGARNGITAPGHHLDLYEVTATVQYDIWRGLFARAEYRHDEASRRAFEVRNDAAPHSTSQDTLSLDLYYVFL